MKPEYVIILANRFNDRKSSSQINTSRIVGALLLVFLISNAVLYSVLAFDTRIPLDTISCGIRSGIHHNLDRLRKSPHFLRDEELYMIAGLCMHRGEESKTTSFLQTERRSGRLPDRSVMSASVNYVNNYNEKSKSERSRKNHIMNLFQTAKDLERRGQWREAADKFLQILKIDPKDSHSYLALAKLEARRNRNDASIDKASQIFSDGTKACPKSVHLWQAWAVHEESKGNIESAKKLFESALKLEPFNPYVCHAYGLMIQRCNMEETGVRYSCEARELWEIALSKSSTAALVCSLGEMLIYDKEYGKARAVYDTHLSRLKTSREKTEVYLAMAWLEERYYSNWTKAEELLEQCDPRSSVSQVALARFKSRKQQRYGTSSISNATIGKMSKIGSKTSELRAAMARSLASACMRIENEDKENQPLDGRIYNSWASLEVKANRLLDARKILSRGLKLYPNDHSLLQAAGKVEERMTNFSGARDFYVASLLVEPNAPALVSYALLELILPNDKREATEKGEYVKQIFEEALLIDPKHGPAYNAYARYMSEFEHNETMTRRIYKRGIRANCTDCASIYHGYAKFELSLGNAKRARDILLEGKGIVSRSRLGMDSPHRERAVFLTHTLGMLELSSNRPKDGLDVFTEGMDLYGNSSQLLLGAALCEVKLGKEDRARQLFEVSLSYDEKHVQAWHAWGVMEMRAGNFFIAKDLFESGIKNSANHKVAILFQAYGTMLSRLGTVEKARKLFEKGIASAPNYVPLYEAWSVMELREENYSAARALIAKALTINKRIGTVWLVAAEIEDRAGATGLVNLLLRRGIECSPNCAKLYRALGDNFVKQGKFSEAREVFEKGIEVDPLHAPLYHSLAELEARLFNIEGLAKLNKRAASVFNANALVPPPRSLEMWGSKIRAGRSRSIPNDVAALSQRIVEEDLDNGETAYSNPEQFLNEILDSVSLLDDGLDTELYTDCQAD